MVCLKLCPLNKSVQMHMLASMKSVETLDFSSTLTVSLSLMCVLETTVFDGGERINSNWISTSTAQVICMSSKYHPSLYSRSIICINIVTISAYTNNTAFTHPSNSGLFVTCAIFPQATRPLVVTSPKSLTFTSIIVPFVKTPRFV